jgi:AcrR family transcriptional regulator
VTEDSAPTRERILAAARREFADKGLNGARVDAIAAAADVNVRMLYHYFGNKDGLYREVLRGIFESRPAELNEPVESLAAALVRYARGFAASPERIQLMLRESLDLGRDPAPDDIVLGPQRADALAERIEHVRQVVADHPAFDDFDIEMLYLALAAIAIFPNTFTTTTRMITGTSPASAEFQQRFEEFLTKFGELIATPSPARLVSAKE